MSEKEIEELKTRIDQLEKDKEAYKDKQDNLEEIKDTLKEIERKPGCFKQLVNAFATLFLIVLALMFLGLIIGGS